MSEPLPPFNPARLRGYPLARLLVYAESHRAAAAEIERRGNEPPYRPPAPVAPERQLELTSAALRDLERERQRLLRQLRGQTDRESGRGRGRGRGHLHVRAEQLLETIRRLRRQKRALIQQLATEIETENASANASASTPAG